MPRDTLRTMRLLERQTGGEICLTADLLYQNLPRYAILSHTWGDDGEEVSYTDLVQGFGDAQGWLPEDPVLYRASCKGRFAILMGRHLLH